MSKKSKVLVCDKCGYDYVRSSFEFVDHPEHGTVCKLCALEIEKYDKGSIFRRFIKGKDNEQ